MKRADIVKRLTSLHGVLVRRGALKKVTDSKRKDEETGVMILKRILDILNAA